MDEQRAVYHSGHPDKILWALWSAKETAYKAVSKSFPDISSSPGRYAVRFKSFHNTGTATGKVNTPKGVVVAVTIYFHNEFLHCIGTTGKYHHLHAIISGVEEVKQNASATEIFSKKESKAVRRLAKKGIAAHLQVKETDIEIIRQKTLNKIMPPSVYINGNTQRLDISLSHDGRFAAYAFLAH